MNRQRFLNLFDFPYVNGESVRVSTCKDVGINALFVQDGIRPGFIVQQVDYEDEKVYKKIINLVVKNLTQLVCVKLWVGDLIFRADNERILQILSSNNLTDSNIGKMIGYSCAEDFESKNEHRSIVTISIDGVENSDILAQICVSPKNIQKVHRLYKKMQNYILIHRLNVRLKFTVEK